MDAAINRPPLANTFSVTLDEDPSAAIVLTVPARRSSHLTFAIINGPTNGVISGFNTNTGALIYTPNANFDRTDSFTLLANDVSTNSAPATVSLMVAAVNHPPLANNLSVTLDEDTSAAIVL